jgi:hypothetical protein
MQTPIERLATRINEALKALEGGWLTLDQAIELTRPFKSVAVPQDLFPGEPRFEAVLQNNLSLLAALCNALCRYLALGIPPETKLRDIPLLTRGIRAAIDAALDNKPGLISFS